MQLATAHEVAGSDPENLRFLNKITWFTAASLLASSIAMIPHIAACGEARTRTTGSALPRCANGPKRFALSLCVYNHHCEGDDQ
jgi:hypothetical protein